jgi:PIN like domain
MTARDGELRFCVDESALGLGKALAAARFDTIHIGHPLIPECPYGTSDEDWIPRVAQRGLVSIGRDKHIRTRPAERRRLHQGGLRVFRIGGKRDLSTWEWLTLVVRHWERIETVLMNRPQGPWFYLINENGLSEVPLIDPPAPPRPVKAKVDALPDEPEEDRLAGLFDAPKRPPRLRPER